MVKSLFRSVSSRAVRRSLSAALPLVLAACATGSSPPGTPDAVTVPTADSRPQGTTPVAARSTRTAARPEVKARLLADFSAREQKLNRDDLLKAGSPDEVEAALVEIATDETAKLQHRLGAVGALRWFATPVVKATLEDAIQNPAGSVAIRRSAVRSYAVFGDDALPVLEKTLASDDLHTRTQSILSLREVGSPKARALVESRMAMETDEAVKTTGKTTLSGWK